MFTGIVQDVGSVKEFRREGESGYRLVVSSPFISKDALPGASVAVNGVCLTVTKRDNALLSFDIMAETVKRTTLTDLAVGSEVNLEHALKLNGFLDGHLVQGHVDCVGVIIKITRGDGGVSYRISFPSGHSHLIVEKGSITIDGVSLTVGKVGPDKFDIFLIPHTLSITTLGKRSQGDRVNLEFDIIGKYLYRLNSVPPPSKITDSFLREHGFAS